MRRRHGADYTAAYNPLKAYLITTSNPDKSVPQWVTPVFLQYWLKSWPVDPARSQLARQQIDFYAGELLRQNPYAISRGFRRRWFTREPIFLTLALCPAYTRTC